MKAGQAEASAKRKAATVRPVLRTLYDHTAAVTALAFHPFRDVLAAGAENATLSLFAYTKEGAKHAFFQTSDTAPVAHLSWDPSGECLLLAPHEPCFRLLDMRSGVFFTSPELLRGTESAGGLFAPAYPHLGAALTHCAHDERGALFSTCDTNGNVALWDRRTLARAHVLGAHMVRPDLPGPAFSAEFSRCGDYLLTAAGLHMTEPSHIRLWDLRALRAADGPSAAPVQTYAGVSLGKTTHLAGGGVVHAGRAHFSHDQSLVIAHDSRKHIHFFEAASGACAGSAPSLHQGDLNGLAVSPAQPHLVSCSQDSRVRFWAY